MDERVLEKCLNWRIDSCRKATLYPNSKDQKKLNAVLSNLSMFGIQFYPNILALKKTIKVLLCFKQSYQCLLFAVKVIYYFLENMT